ncbi:hypothetical protein ACQPXM_09180 [Kribbella sp. CA-253562]|uniref:hypothetical protein n=1 Tax=Kribbella sp. CA-253562 TaxID=3239942 RepID=UPI003D935F3B
MLSGLLVATPAHAATTSVTSPDGGALGQVAVAASGNFTLIAKDKSCDARGAVLHYKITGVWHTLGDSSCHGDAAFRGPIASGHGLRIDIYVCNTNTRTGYKSCSSTKRVTT